MQSIPSATASQRQAEYTPVDLVLLLFQAQGEFASLLAGQAKADDLGPSEVAALLALARGPAPISGIARIVGIRPNGASVLVDRLHARGLVARERSSRDNRVVSVGLTEKGEEIARRLQEHAEARIEDRLAGLTPAEREQLPVLLARILS